MSARKLPPPEPDPEAGRDVTKAAEVVREARERVDAARRLAVAGIYGPAEVFAAEHAHVAAVRRWAIARDLETLAEDERTERMTANRDDLPPDPDLEHVPDWLAALDGRPVVAVDDDGAGPAVLVIVPGLWGEAHRRASGFYEEE